MLEENVGMDVLSFPYQSYRLKKSLEKTTE